MACQSLFTLVLVSLGAWSQISLSAQERLELIVDDYPELVIEDVDVSVGRFGEVRHVTRLSSIPRFPVTRGWRCRARYLVESRSMALLEPRRLSCSIADRESSSADSRCRSIPPG